MAMISHFIPEIKTSLYVIKTGAIVICFLISYVFENDFYYLIEALKLRLDMHISFYINPYISAVEDEDYVDTTEFLFTDLWVG